MKVGLIAPPWLAVPPRSYGGTEEVLDQLARGLVAAGHEVVLFTVGESTCAVPRRWARARAESERMNHSLPELAHVLAAYDELEGCDVIHDHTVCGPLVAANRRVRPPVVVTNHGPFDDEANRVFAAVAGRVAVVAISHAQARASRGFTVSRVIHHGVDLETFATGRGDGGYFLFLGRMAAEKGVDRAARVARRLGVRLLIAARCQGPREQSYLDEAVRPLLGGGVEYIGEVDGVDKRELLRGAVALVNPVDWPEPFGMVMVEALACGTPVLARDRGAAAEIVLPGRTGLLCEDDDELAAAMKLVDHLDRSACRADVEARFDVRRQVAEHVELYACCSGERPGGVVSSPLVAG